MSTYLPERISSLSSALNSDSCGGQNRNINMVCLWLHVVSSAEYSYTTIDHKFMISGHSYLPNDRDFGSIETAKRRLSALYVPEEWCELVRKSRRVNPFPVRRMYQSDFKSVSQLRSEIVNRKKNTDKQKVEWLKMHWIRVQKSSPLCFQYRYTINTLEPWKTVNLRRRRAGRPSDLGRVDLLPLYDGPRPISAPKYRDLQELLSYVPPVHHAFFNGLLSKSSDTMLDSAAEDDSDMESESDEEAD